MIKTPLGRIAETSKDTNLLADMLEKAGNKAGYFVNREGSSISPSQYLTFSNGIDDIMRQVRISNHADKHPSLASGIRYSSDPVTGNTFEQAVNWLNKEGFPTNLSTRYRNILSYDDYLKQQRYYENMLRAEELNNFKYTPNYKDLMINKTKINNGRRYDLYNNEGVKKTIYSKDIPENIKTNPNPDVLKEFLRNYYFNS